VNRVRLVDKDNVERVERWLERLALDGKLGAQITESEIIQVLSKRSDSTSVTFQRKKQFDESAPARPPVPACAVQRPPRVPRARAPALFVTAAAERGWGCRSGCAVIPSQNPRS